MEGDRILIEGRCYQQQKGSMIERYLKVDKQQIRYVMIGSDCERDI